MENIKVRNILILKTVLGSLFFITFFVLILGGVAATDTHNEKGIIQAVVYLCFGLFFLPINAIYTVLRISTFKFAFGDDFINIKQGIINLQERHVPYAVIQDVIMRRDIMDRILGLSTVVIENASMGGIGGGQYSNQGGSYGMGRNRGMNVYQQYPGMTGNKLTIPGLSAEDAITLREQVLARAIVINQGSRQQEI
jgi:membrane protein YdbS with pleckstrin-like domain